MTALLAVLLAFAATPASSREPGRVLTREEAAFRASAVQKAAYVLRLSLDEKTTWFSGTSEVSFDLTVPVTGLTLDLDSAELGPVAVNGAAVERPEYDGAFLTLPAGLLKVGRNSVSVGYRRAYSSTGAGLYRFVDPEDGRVYLYSQFEPYDANKMFPCFDQPDLKASFSLTVEAPADWEVVSTALDSSSAAAAGRRTWVFPETRRLSTYVFSLHAGPYAVWRSTAGDVPLRLFARRAMARYVAPEEWFDTTRRGLAFYGDYFKFPYPFGKYDQLIVPDFNAGAMENVAAVTFSERNLHRSPPTDDELEDTASDILHEMAHMWFGDIVTMEWWNGLWLNESFATYMAALASARATRFDRAWLSFFAWAKRWAYFEDQLPTTHPVEGPVPDTDHAFSSFDGITYGKGASALKQLAFTLGEDEFRDGVRRYLAKHAYANAREADFFAAMALPLDRWTRAWLETPGLDAVEPELACSGGAVTGLALVAKAPRSRGPARRHRTRVALVRFGEEAPVRAADVEYGPGRTAVPLLAGAPCPDFVVANSGDLDYAKPGLDERSQKAVLGGLGRVADPALRLWMWQALWERVQDARLPPARLLEAVLAHLPAEKEARVLRTVLEMLHGRGDSSPSVLAMLADSGRDAPERALWDAAAASAGGSDLQRIWLDGYLRVARGADAPARLRSLLAAPPALPGLALDQDRRWTVLARLSELGAAGAADLDAEAARDPSDRGRKARLTAEVSRPDPEAKGAWLTKLLDPASGLTLDESRAVMDGFYPRSQAAMRPALLTRTLAALPGLSAARDDDFLDAFAGSMLPSACTASAVAGLERFLRGKPALKPVLEKAVRNRLETERRCVRARSL